MNGTMYIFDFRSFAQQKRFCEIASVDRMSLQNPTFSSILLSLDPIELLPLSLARSTEGDHSHTNARTRGSDSGVFHRFCAIFCESSGVINYLSLLGTKLSFPKTGPV